jgi:xanthine dehydrogenase molybdopterin-binding subunit B
MATNWKAAYQNTLEETDRDKLTQYVLETEGAIFDRIQELESSSDHHKEREEMEAAAKHLLEIKTRKLGWPNPWPSD